MNFFCNTKVSGLGKFLSSENMWYIPCHFITALYHRFLLVSSTPLMVYLVQQPSLETIQNTRYMYMSCVYIITKTVLSWLMFVVFDVQVTVALIDLSPELSYTSVPRLSPHSFLQAKAKNTSHYAMLAGPSNIFLDNNFIAKVWIHTMYMQQYMVHVRNKRQ